MISILSLWAPIVLSAVLVFIASAILHMVLTYHRKDHNQIPDEAKALEALRGAGLERGVYVFPYCATGKEMGTPEMQEKYRQGPVGLITVLPAGPPNMGKALGLWFVFCLLVGVFVAYLAGRTLSPGTDYLEVFRYAGTIAFVAYGFGELVNTIWKGQPWGTTLRSLVDALIYGLLTGGCFGWLWPG
jgi:hypothetical protein